MSQQDRDKKNEVGGEFGGRAAAIKTALVLGGFALFLYMFFIIYYAVT